MKSQRVEFICKLTLKVFPIFVMHFKWGSAKSNGPWNQKKMQHECGMGQCCQHSCCLQSKHKYL